MTSKTRPFAERNPRVRGVRTLLQGLSDKPPGCLETRKRCSSPTRDRLSPSANTGRTPLAPKNEDPRLE